MFVRSHACNVHTHVRNVRTHARTCQNGYCRRRRPHRDRYSRCFLFGRRGVQSPTLPRESQRRKPHTFSLPLFPLSLVSLPLSTTFLLSTPLISLRKQHRGSGIADSTESYFRLERISISHISIAPLTQLTAVRLIENIRLLFFYL